MSNYNWCHNPDCHTIETQSRVRGSGDNKVIRTKKVTNKSDKSMFGNGGSNIWNFFCCHHCLMDYIRTHLTSVIAIAPRRNALETPIKVEKEKYESYRYEFNSGPNNETQRVPYMATRTTIKSVDNN